MGSQAYPAAACCWKLLAASTPTQGHSSVGGHPWAVHITVCDRCCHANELAFPGAERQHMVVHGREGPSEVRFMPEEELLSLKRDDFRQSSKLNP
mmetsp:Transcript_65553/g.152280  ORF Transcript_65553/g.152280 Transcript_65553/m.152280 type:complete len:95 (-) Transcript_65553:102-386(-)